MLAKETKKTRKKMILLSLLAIVLLLSAGLLVYCLVIVKHQAPATNNGSEINLNEPSIDELEEGQRIKQNTVDQDEDTQQPEDTSSAAQIVSVSLNGIQNGSQVVFDTLIQQVLSEGQCSLTITSGGQTVRKTATIFPGPSTSSCRGFAVGVSELPTGKWHATLQITSGNYAGSAKSEVEVQ